MNTNEIIASIAYEILCTINANDKGNGVFYPIHRLHESMCFNERNHPNGMGAPFNEALRRLIDKELIWMERVNTGNASHPIYGMYEAGYKALHSHKNGKVYV